MRRVAMLPLLVFLGMPALQAGAAASGTAPARPYGNVVYVRGDKDFEAVCDARDAWRVPIPLTSRSERVVRAARTARGIGVRIAVGAGDVLSGPPPMHLDLRFVVHGDDERIVRDSGGTLWRLSNLRLPKSVTKPGDEDEKLPWVARQDENGLFGPLVVMDDTPSAKERLVVTLCPWTLHERPGTYPSAAFVQDGKRTRFSPPRNAFEAVLSPPDAALSATSTLEIDPTLAVDQIVWARAQELDPSQGTPLRCRETGEGVARFQGRSARAGQGLAWPRITLENGRFSAFPAGASPHVAGITAGTVRELWFENPPEAKPGSSITLILAFPPDDLVEATEPRAPPERRLGLFGDTTRASGVDAVHMEGPDLQLDIRPTMGPGAAFGDIDGDGWVDLFLPQGGGREGSNVPASRMYRNRGDGTFEDVSHKCGLALRGAGMGALFLDADGDGDLDLFVANQGANRMLLNDGRGNFTDVSGPVGLQRESWHAAVSAADHDKDGDLDLYVTSYLRYDEAQMPPAEELGRYQREDPIAMLPFAFPGETKEFLRNDRVVAIEADTKPKPPFRFTDVAKELGLVDEGGRGMQAIFWDFDRDSDQDLYLANDVSPNRFWRNEGNGQWKDIGFSTGLDDPRGCMGLAVGDIDGDGDEDLFITNWQLEANALYVNNLVSHSSAKSRVATFRDNAVQAGLGQPSVGVTGWGCELADFDLDGDLDLAVANGYTSPDYESTGICVGQPCHYFENGGIEAEGEGTFTPAFETAGSDLALPLAARCLLACDWDQDGDLDLVVTANNGRVRLLRNELEHGKRHWLGVRLRGRGANTQAIGAEVTVKAGGRTVRRSLRAGTSYLGGNAPELHFGLGEATKVDACVVRWPDGRETSVAIERVDTFVTLAEP